MYVCEHIPNLLVVLKTDVVVQSNESNLKVNIYMQSQLVSKLHDKTFFNFYHLQK